MTTPWEIEHEWDAAKLLITRMSHKTLFFLLPQYGLYVDSAFLIPKAYRKQPQGIGYHLRIGNPREPHIVTVKSKDISRVADFIREHPEFQAYRIFKHGTNFKGLKIRNMIGIVCETTKNMLHLYPGKTFRILSDNKTLRQLFYEKAMVINQQDDLGCSFDYENYDYTLDIRAYKRYREGKFFRWAVVTILYGEDLPNRWVS